MDSQNNRLGYRWFEPCHRLRGVKALALCIPTARHEQKCGCQAQVPFAVPACFNAICATPIKAKAVVERNITWGRDHLLFDTMCWYRVFYLQYSPTHWICSPAGCATVPLLPNPVFCSPYVNLKTVFKCFLISQGLFSCLTFLHASLH